MTFLQFVLIGPKIARLADKLFIPCWKFFKGTLSSTVNLSLTFDDAWIIKNLPLYSILNQQVSFILAGHYLLSFEIGHLSNFYNSPNAN